MGMEKTYLTKEATAHINSTERRFQQIEHRYSEDISLMKKKVTREKAAYDANQEFLLKRTKELHEMGDEWQLHYEETREKKETIFEQLTKDEEGTRTELKEAAALRVQRAWAWHKKYGPPPKKKKKKKK